MNIYEQYMPSIAEVAQCSKDSEGGIRGCDGGSPTDIWNHWMMGLDRGLWLHNKACMPYTLKCNASPDGFTNEVGPSCDTFEPYFVWSRPCRCIPRGVIAKRLFCRSDTPPAQCAHEVPPAFFLVKSVAHGLTIQETVLNMQRHILEYGPISVSTLLTREFMNWDFRSKPVYTGGNTLVAGGHVLIALGWGNLGGTDFWLLRNSWGETWGDASFCRFQRGVNLDTIEERGVSASMPTASYRDWSEPVCDFKGMRWNWWKAGDGTLTNFTGFIDVGCAEACSLGVFLSSRLASADDAPAAQGGKNQTRPGVAGGKATFQVNLLELGFGNEDGHMYIGITASDAEGNVGETHASMRIPPVG